MRLGSERLIKADVVPLIKGGQGMWLKIDCCIWWIFMHAAPDWMRQKHVVGQHQKCLVVWLTGDYEECIPLGYCPFIDRESLVLVLSITKGKLLTLNQRRGSELGKALQWAQAWQVICPIKKWFFCHGLALSERSSPRSMKRKSLRNGIRGSRWGRFSNGGISVRSGPRFVSPNINDVD